LSRRSRTRIKRAFPRYRLADMQAGEEYDIGADDLVRIVGVELAFIDWAIHSDGAFENGLWRVEPR